MIDWVISWKSFLFGLVRFVVDLGVVWVRVDVFFTTAVRILGSFADMMM